MHQRLILKAQGKKQSNIQYESDDSLSSDDEELLSNSYVGKLYNNRYSILKYLGKGTFSRLWIVYDIITNSFRALKLQNKEDIEEGKNEVKLIGNINHNNIIKIYDHFFDDKTNTLGIVLELLGDDLFTMLDIFDIIPTDILKNIFRQILSGIGVLHDKNIIHTDIKLENILIDKISPKNSRFINFIKDNLDIDYQTIVDKSLPDEYNTYTTDKKKKIKRRLKLKSIKIINTKLLDIVNKYKESGIENNDDTYNQIDYHNINVKIIDLGNGELVDDISNDEISYKLYRSPENILGYEYNTKTDIWTLGCIFYEIITKKYLIEIGKSKDDIDRDRKLLSEMQSILGKIPKDFALNAEYSDELVDHKGRILKYKDIKNVDVKEILSEFLNENDTKKFIDMLFKMLNYEPKNRYNIKDCLSHIFLQVS
jgi:serine/threonine-protein kinase SRPK3